MQKINKYLLVIFSFFILISKSYALEVSKTDFEMIKGESSKLELYANVKELSSSVIFTMTYSTYDVQAGFIVNDQYQDLDPNSSTHEVLLDKPTDGKIFLGYIYINTKKYPNDGLSGQINLNNAKYINQEQEQVSLDNLNINITLVDNYSCQENKNLLNKITSNIVKINILDDIYEYEVNIKSDVEELDLKAIPEKEDYQVEISSQKISELKDNKITIKVSDGCNNEEYTVKVNIIKDIEEVAIDNSKSNIDDSYKNNWIKIISILGIILFITIIFTPKKKR